MRFLVRSIQEWRVKVTKNTKMTTPRGLAGSRSIGFRIYGVSKYYSR